MLGFHDLESRLGTGVIDELTIAAAKIQHRGVATDKTGEIYPDQGLSDLVAIVQIGVQTPPIGILEFMA